MPDAASINHRVRCIRALGVRLIDRRRWESVVRMVADGDPLDKLGQT